MSPLRGETLLLNRKGNWKMIRRKKILRLASALVALLLVLPLIASCADFGGGKETDTDTEAPAEVRYLIKDGEALFSIIRSSYCSDAVASATTAVFKTIRDKTGVRPDYSEDLISKDRTDNEDFEILVGSTNRKESVAKLAELTTKDWYVGPYGSKILVIGGDDASTLKAIARFSEIVGANIAAMGEDGDLVLGDLGTEYLYRHEYPSAEISVGGKKISGYTIYYGSDKYAKEIAENIAAKITDTCGAVLKVSRCPTSKDKIGEDCIIVGKTVADRSVELTASFGYAEKIPYALSCEGGRLYLCGYEWGLYAAAEKLFDDFLDAGKDIPDGYYDSADLAGSPSVPLTTGCDIRVMTNNVWKCDNNQPAWKELGYDCSAKTRAEGFIIVYVAFKPDIINLQEMSQTMLSYIKSGLKAAGLNYRAVCYAPGEPDDTPLLYNADVLELKTSGHHVYTYGNNGNTKSYTWGLFVHKETGTQFLNLSTHLWWKSESVEPGSNESRLRQAKEITALADKLVEKYSCPMIISGDLNCNINSTAIAELKNGGFEDCYDLASSKDNTRGHHACSASGFSTELYEGAYSSAIDHMFIRNKGVWSVSVFRQPVCSFYWQLTDHIPVYSDIAFNLP
jgi:hypothetical protein